MEKFKIINIKDIEKLPKTAGVYAFYEKTIKVAKKSQVVNCSLLATRYSLNPIYIGKAINIQSRVKNHFNQPSYRDNLFMNLVEKVGFLETGSEISALILEASLIKKFQPKYNVVWKDDKNYFYVAIRYTQGKLKIPYVFITHQPHENLKFQILNFKFKYIGPFTEGAPLKNTLRVLRKIFPFYTSKTHPKNKCTWCHLELCPGPNPDIKQYKKDIKSLTLILQGKKNTALNLLKKEMVLASKEQNFEQAGKIRDQISNLQQVMSHSNIARFNLATESNWSQAEKKLRNILNIKNNINKIECYDISNIQGTLAVGSMVVFVNGLPDKSQYKKFRIQIENKPNDIAMLKEVISRRLRHEEWPYPEVILMDGGKAQLNTAISVISNLIGNPELSTQTLDSRFRGNDKTSIKIIAIAKGRQELFIEGQEKATPLKDLPQEIYNLIKNLDDEAHRFAITYHKKLRKNYLLK